MPASLRRMGPRIEASKFRMLYMRAAPILATPVPPHEDIPRLAAPAPGSPSFGCISPDMSLNLGTAFKVANELNVG